MVDDTTRETNGSGEIETDDSDVFGNPKDDQFGIDDSSEEEESEENEIEFDNSGKGVTESSPTTSASMGTRTQDPQSQEAQQPRQTAQGQTAVGTNKGNMKFCEHCGSEISMEAEICPNCGVRLETNEKSPGVAALLSAVINGGGQLYNGDVAKGAIIFGVQIVNVMLMFVVIGFITFPIVWIYSVYDAYKTAQSR